MFVENPAGYGLPVTVRNQVTIDVNGHLEIIPPYSDTCRVKLPDHHPKATVILDFVIIWEHHTYLMT